MSNLLIDIEKDMKSSSFSEIQRNNLCLSASRQVDEIVSQLRLSWQHNRVLCALLSKLTVIFEGSYSVSDTTGKSRKEMWSNVFYIVERVAERGRVEEAGLSVEERVEFYKLLEKSPVEVIKAKNLMRFFTNFFQTIAFNFEAGFTDVAVKELLGSIHILELMISSPTPEGFRIVIDSGGGELVCTIIEVLSPLQNNSEPGAGKIKERLIKLCRELVKRGVNGKARSNVEELHAKCSILHPTTNEILERKP